MVAVQEGVGSEREHSEAGTGALGTWSPHHGTCYTQLPALGLQTVADGQVPKQKRGGGRRGRILCLAWFGGHSPQSACPKLHRVCQPPGRGILGKGHQPNSRDNHPKKTKARLRGADPHAGGLRVRSKARSTGRTVSRHPVFLREPPSQRPRGEMARVGKMPSGGSRRPRDSDRHGVM